MGQAESSCPVTNCPARVRGRAKGLRADGAIPFFASIILLDLLEIF
jgi:hypothetical protein